MAVRSFAHHSPALPRCVVRLCICLLLSLGACTQAVAKSTPPMVMQISPAGSAALGQPITLFATVTHTGGSAPTGTVDFAAEGYVVICKRTLVTSLVQCVYTPPVDTPLQVGQHTIGAYYLGDSNYWATGVLTNNYQITKATPTISISVAPAVVAPGQKVLVSITVAAPSGNLPALTGNIDVELGVGSHRYFALTPGVSSVSYELTPDWVGSMKSIYATYAGDGHFSGAGPKGALITVTKYTSTTTMSPANGYAGETIQLHADVTGPGVTGGVTFREGSAILCNSVALTPGPTIATATCAAAGLGVGQHGITAEYSGNATFDASSGNGQVQIAKNTTNLVLSASPDPATSGQKITAQVVLTSSTSTTKPTGSVSIGDGAVGCNASLSAGAGSCALTFAAAGTHMLNATYPGDASYAASSASHSIRVDEASNSSVNLNQFGLSGAWYNPATSGQGLVLSVMPDQVSPGHGILFAGWFTYDVAPSGGVEKQRWYVLQGDVDNTHSSATLPILSVGGGNFDAPPKPDAAHVGDATIHFSDCAHGTLDYHFTDGSARSGSIALTRLDANLTCSPSGDNGHSAPAYRLSGAWYDPTTSGQGIVLITNPEQQLLFAAWYTFAPNALASGVAGQRWYVMQIDGYLPGRAPIKDIPILAGIGGIFDDPHPRTSPTVGKATLTFTDCGQALLNYSFDSGSNAGLSDTIPLQRLGNSASACGL